MTLNRAVKVVMSECLLGEWFSRTALNRIKKLMV